MSLTAFDIKIAAVACSLMGTLLLAVRVKRILTALSLVARVHEKNFEQGAHTSAAQVVFTGSTKHLKRAEASGVTLLVVGFVLLVLAAALNGYAIYLERPARTIAERGGPADGRQPLQSVTNRTPEAAGFHP